MNVTPFDLMTFFQKKLALTGITLEEFQNKPFCFKANFHDEVNGIDGYTKLRYNGLFDTLMKVDIAFTEYPDTNLVYNSSGAECTFLDSYDNVAPLDVRINSYWSYDQDIDILNREYPQNYLFGQEQCLPIIQGTYDPLYACGANSANSEACVAEGRPANGCAVGDMVCINGGVTPLEASSFFDVTMPAPRVEDYLFRTSQQNWASVSVACAGELLPMFCAKLDLIDCVTEEVIDVVQFAKMEIEQAKIEVKESFEQKKGLVGTLLSTVLRSDILLTQLTNLL